MAFIEQTPPPFSIAPTGDVLAAGSLLGAILNYIWTYAPGAVTLFGGCLAIAWYSLQLYSKDN